MAEPVVFEVDWNSCIRCAACIAVCPHPPGFVSPFDTIAVDTPCDIACMRCEAVCPVTAIRHESVPAGNVSESGPRTP
ncbi:MAG: 4Fe-4S binding protein [Rhodothermales bacterium]